MTYSLLCLGDSYTVGEGVSLFASFPYQLVQLLRKRGFDMEAPEIVAVTGYTTGELLALLDRYQVRYEYDFVTLLIGVNNQYRGQSEDVFSSEIEKLITNAIGLAGSRSGNVILLSIPDWGVTPFAEKHDRKKIAFEIDSLNKIIQKFSLQYGTAFLDITELTREAAGDESLLTSDKLHPSAKEYNRWSDLLCEIIMSKTQQDSSEHIQ